MLRPQSTSAEIRRRLRGFSEPDHHGLDLTFGDSDHIDVPAGCIVSITNVDGGAACWLTALSAGQRDFSPAALDLPQDKATGIKADLFDNRVMSDLARNRDSTLDRASVFAVFDETTAPGQQFITQANETTTLFVVVPAQHGFLSRGGGGSFRVDLRYPPGAHTDRKLPPPLGKVVDEWRIDRGTARAYELKKGQFVQILDVDGQQCSDFMAMRADALHDGVERHIDSTVSRTVTRSAYPLPGLHDKFFDQDIRPLLAVRQDTVGRHDTFALACTARGYEERGFPGHLNCSDNISAAFAPYGIGARRAWPAINFFFNSWIDWADNAISSDEAWSRPGDYVVLNALTDLVCVSTACPDDVDPINGWNPTDIHVRVYEDDSSISHSVAWRAQPEDRGKLTRHSAFHPSTSRRTRSYQVAREIWMPTQYDATGAVEEYWACRHSATLQDMSGLRKFDIVGPDAEELLDHCLTRDPAKLSQHRGFYALMCDARGSILDDGTLFRLEPTAFRWCCGSDDSALHLREHAEALQLNARVLSLGHKMPNLAIQGPKSRDILREVVCTQPTRPALENLKWFGFTVGRLFDRDGPAFMLCRTGFTGELGYEIFCDQNDAVQIWDGLMDVGEKHGLVAMGSEALEMLRIEAGLMSSGAEFGPDCDAFESGLGFAVDFKKKEFVGRAALERNSASIRRKLVGLAFQGNEHATHGDAVFLGREQVGVVTSSCYSPHLKRAIAMARIAVENADADTELEVGKLDGRMKRLPCKVTELPFIDPQRAKPRA